MTQPDPAAGIRETARILQTAAREHHARRAAVRAILATTPRADSTSHPPTGPHGTGHRYDWRCALCTGDLDALTDALLGVVHGWEQQQPTDWPTSCAACARVLETGIRETDRANRAVAQLDQVAALRDDLAGITGARWIAAALDHILNPEPGPAATQATSPHTGLVIEPYRNDRGDHAWVFRCWGTDTCDGWLSLDHSSEQSAQRARDRHIAEEHTDTTPKETPA